MKQLTYYVTKDNITPKDIIEIGFAGEHLATRIIFNLSDELLDAERYLLNITNGGGEFFAVDGLIVSGNQVIYDLPNFVTAISGILKLQLVIVADDSVLYSYPCELRVLSNAEGSSSAINYLSEINDALNICRAAALKATDTLNAVNDNSAEHNRIVGDIETALEEIIYLQEYYIGGEAK